MGLASGRSSAQEPFFPIGIWEAQRVPTACGGADSTTLDEISASGINAVFCWFHADYNYAFTTPEQVECYLDEAESLGLKALVRLSETRTFGPSAYGTTGCWDTTCTGYEGEYWLPGCSAPSNYPALIARNPPDTTYHASLIRHVAGHNALFGLYLADEPINNNLSAIAPSDLETARSIYRTVDDAFPRRKRTLFHLTL